MTQGKEPLATDVVDKDRRRVLKTLANATVAFSVGSRAPYVFARTKTKLRVLGTHVTLQEACVSRP
jgi:putative spermidine/putrescine transport system substrate-binding protein